VSLALFVAAFATFIAIVHETFPYLPEEERTRIRSVGTGLYLWPPESWKQGRAMQHAWAVHGTQFPNSCKRILFAALLIAASLSLMADPLWIVFEKR
jgi:hypothetical protein